MISMGEIEEYEIEDRWMASERAKKVKEQQSLRDGVRMRMCVKFDSRSCHLLKKYISCGLPKGNCQSKHHKR